jgi:methionine synthase II (cobalamin-independent)
MLNFKGLATGIGSLPHQDAEEATELIFKYLPDIPFWPQLPKRDMREGMVAQFSENLPCLEIRGKNLIFNPEDKDRKLELFYERVIASDAQYFKISPDFASGLYRFYQRLKGPDLEKAKFIKCQVTGPFTFAAAINDDNNRALLYDPVFMQAILKGLTMKALWQIEFFKKFGKKMIVFFDEPYLGSFGSAYTPLSRDEVVKGLTELMAGVKSKEIVLTGVHCCGNTDWSIFTQIRDIDIISFDAFSFLDKFLLYAKDLRDFLNRGGIICWGIVPTQLFSGEETADLLIRRLKEGIDALSAKGIERDLLFENLLVSPSCGLGTFAPEKSEKIFKLLSETSDFLKK